MQALEDGKLSLHSQPTFKDGIRTIDFILVYEIDSNVKIRDKREEFQSNLKKAGLELEECDSDEATNVRFVKVHAPADVCRDYCANLMLKMPTKKRFQRRDLPSGSIWSRLSRLVDYDQQLFPQSTSERCETAIFSRAREHLFDVNSTDFFTPSVRATIVDFILKRTSFSSCGIDIDQVYCAAYPLHQGSRELPDTPKHALSHGWSSLRNILRRQPLDHVAGYFGAEIGLYFAWLGFYTYMLLFPAIVGMTYSLYSWYTSPDCFSWSVDGRFLPCIGAFSSVMVLKPYDFLRSNAICGEDVQFYTAKKKADLKKLFGIDEDHPAKQSSPCIYCAHWEIRSTCLGNTTGPASHAYEDWILVVFTVFMFIWSTILLELWKRYSEGLTRRWGATVMDERAEFLAGFERPRRRTTLTLPLKLLNSSSTVLLICVALVGVNILSMLSRGVHSVLEWGWSYFELQEPRQCRWDDEVRACVRSLSALFLNLVYVRLAKYFTDLELHRTQSAHDHSLIRKLCTTNFINYYAPLFYTLSLRGKAFVGWPADIHLHILPSRLIGLLAKRQEACGLDGCLAELRVELAEIMISKQAINAENEYLRHFLLCRRRGRKIRSKTEHGREGQDHVGPSTDCEQWIRDYKLLPFGHQPMFPEYTEMVVQFGFVMLFAYAFPLAPLFAWLNNIFEIRLDAKKMIAFHRRPVPSPLVKRTNAWHEIVESILNLAVFTNSFIIAFMSDIIPKTVHRLKFSHDSDKVLPDYLKFSLSYTNISTAGECSSDIFDECGNLKPDASICRAELSPDFSAWSMLDKVYMYFWICLTARFLFMMVFQNFLTILIGLIRRQIRSMKI